MEQALDQGFLYLVSLEIRFAYSQTDQQGVSVGLGTGCEWLSDTDMKLVQIWLVPSRLSVSYW